MATTLTASDKIKKILAEAQAEVAKLTAEALAELQAKLKEARAVVAGIEADIAELTGKPAKAPRRSAKVQGRTVTPAELKKALKDGETNTRKLAKALGTTNTEVIATAKSNPDAFKVTAKPPHYFVEAK